MARWKLKSDIPLFYPDKDLPAYDETELKLLVERYVADPSYRNILIESQMRLTFTIASLYVSKYKHDQEELVSDALYSLVKAVDRFRLTAATNPESSLPAYVNKTIWLELKSTVLKNRLIPIPSTILHRKLRDGTLQEADVMTILGDSDVHETTDHIKDSDERDLINVVINCDENKRILKMRIARYEDHEIADELRVKVSYIWNKCREIRQSLSLFLNY